MVPNTAWKESYEGSMKWTTDDDTYSVIKTETIEWRIDPNLAANLIINDLCFQIDLWCYGGIQTRDDWYIDAEFEILVQLGNIEFPRKGVHHFRAGKMRNAFETFSTLDDLMISEMKSSGRCCELLIKTKIRIKSAFGVVLSKFSIPQNIDSEIVCRLGNHLLYINKYPLLCFSSKLREKLSLLNDGEILDIDSIEYADFVTFLEFLYGQQRKVNADNIYGLLLAASKYDVDFYMSDCEDFIISTQDLSISYKICLSIEFRLPRVHTSIMNNITIDELKQVLNELTFFDGSNINEVISIDDWKRCLNNTLLIIPKNAIENVIKKKVTKICNWGDDL